MTVADAYDAITSSRPYRDNESPNYAVKEIIKCSGVQFDPEVVGHFLEVAKGFVSDRNGGAAKESPDHRFNDTLERN
jgi:HD-GYP domain-containing protein (c-di-GMP phosphodiesterase class II)